MGQRPKRRPALTLTNARQSFEFHNKASNLSPLTTDWYNKRLLSLEQFLCASRKVEADALTLDTITVDDLRAFMAHLQGKDVKWETHGRRNAQRGPLSPVTIRGYRRALSAFFNWAFHENLVAQKTHDHLETNKLPQVVKKNFTEQEIKALLKAAEEHADITLASRDRALVLFLMDTGVRASELCGMTLDDIDPSWQRVKIRGKGMRERFVPLSPATRAALHQYVTFYRPVDVDRLNRVFLTNKARAMARYILGLILRYLGERANVKGVHPHRFRRTAGTQFYENSHGNLFRTQELLGHSSPMTTRIYVGKSTQDLERVHADASPVEKWGLK